jgi:hypothetical protein
MLVGVALSQSARRPTPVRLQGEEDQSVRVRGVRTHDQRARSPLPSLERETPLQSCPAQILRQATLQVYEFEFRKHAAPSTYLIFLLFFVLFIYLLTRRTVRLGCNLSGKLGLCCFIIIFFFNNYY